MDEKGRLIVPSKLREELEKENLVITRGLEKCLWLFKGPQWDGFSGRIEGDTNLFHKNGRLIQRFILGSAQQVDMDKTGRITINRVLRKYAGLEKNNIIVECPGRYEIWEENIYDDYLQQNESALRLAMEGFADQNT